MMSMYAMAAADGVERSREAPLRALFGDQAYDALADGEQSDLHYLGNDRLAPDFTLRDRSGRPFRLSDHRGKVIVLNFWSITCRPCVEELPSFTELTRLMAERDDVEIVTVSTDSGWDEVGSLFAGDARLRVLFDSEREVVTGMYGTRLFPETWIIDPQGVIRLRVDGARDWSSAYVRDIITSYL